VFDSPGVNAAIYVTDADGRHTRRLTSLHDPNLVEPERPDFSPDGKKIIFDDSFGGELFLMYADGRHVRRLVSPPRSVNGIYRTYNYRDPVFSPDGKQVAADLAGYFGPGLEVVGTGEVVVMNANGTAVHEVATGDAFSPSWGPTA
jgi:Tol biopolymer transport system component